MVSFVWGIACFLFQINPSRIYSEYGKPHLFNISINPIICQYTNVIYYQNRMDVFSIDLSPLSVL